MKKRNGEDRPVMLPGVGSGQPGQTGEPGQTGQPGQSGRGAAPEAAAVEAVLAWDGQMDALSNARKLADHVRAEAAGRAKAQGRVGRRAWIPGFLTVLAHSANVRLACYAAGVNRQYVYGLRSRDEAFRLAWETAMELAVDRLEEEAWRRACDGVEQYVLSYGRPVLDGEGNPLMERRYSDMLLERLLRAHRPAKYREAPVGGEIPTVVKVYSGFDPDQV